MVGDGKSAPRRRLSPADRREQILQAALGLFAHREVASVAVEEVAAAAGVSPALVHHYFGSREGVARAALAAAAADIVDRLLNLPPAEPAEVLALGLDAYLDFLITHPAAWGALVRAGGAAGSELGLAGESARIAREMDDAAVSVALRALDQPDPPAALLLALRGWTAMVKEASVQWTTLDVSRDVLFGVLAVSFHGALKAAAAADPAAQPALDRFEQTSPADGGEPAQ